MAKMNFDVKNMNCSGCVATIRQALEAADHIEAFEITLSRKRVSVESDLPGEDVIKIIQEAGYDAEPATEKKTIFGRLLGA